MLHLQRLTATGQTTPVRKSSRSGGSGGVDTPPKRKKPDRWDHLTEHVDAFDHLLANQDRAPAPTPTSPQTPRRTEGTYFCLSNLEMMAQ